METNMRLMLDAPPTEDNAGAAYQQVAENRGFADVMREFDAIGGPPPAAAEGAAKAAPGSTGNPDLDALDAGGAQPAPAQTVEGVDGKPNEAAPAQAADEEPDLATKVAGW